MSPKPYAVVRSTVIRAEPAVVHGYLADFRQWSLWSPWEDADPLMRRTYTGPEAGDGATYEWAGNRRAGAGRMSVARSTPEVIDIDLSFSRPFPAENQIEFSLRPTDGGTLVTWTMHGELNGVMKLVSLARPMDRWLGPDFDRGLARLKAVAEGASV